MMWRDIEGWLDEDEGGLLQDLVKKMPPGTEWCEIGCWKGRSTACLSQTGVSGYAVDWFEGSQEHSPESTRNLQNMFLQNMHSLGNGGTVVVIVGDSNKVHNMVPGNLGLLFIDGDHSYSGVKADFYNYSPKVVSGGFIAFHDAAPYCGKTHAWPEVEKFVKELLDSGYKHLTTVNRIVVIQK